jgi:hypothetical protein
MRRPGSPSSASALQQLDSLARQQLMAAISEDMQALEASWRNSRLPRLQLDAPSLWRAGVRTGLCSMHHVFYCQRSTLG